jgi:hypothetical protein
VHRIRVGEVGADDDVPLAGKRGRDAQRLLAARAVMQRDAVA